MVPRVELDLEQVSPRSAGTSKKKKEPTPEELLEQARAVAFQEHRRQMAHVRALNLLESKEKFQQQVRADLKRRQNDDSRAEWLRQKDAERELERNRTQQMGADNAAKLGNGWHEDKVLDDLERVKSMAEKNHVSREGNKALVQTYIQGGHKIIADMPRTHKKPEWMARFESTLTSKFDLYSTEQSIRMLRHAFKLAIDAETEEHDHRRRVKEREDLQRQQKAKQEQFMQIQKDKQAKLMHSQARQQKQEADMQAYRESFNKPRQSAPPRPQYVSGGGGGCSDLLYTAENRVLVKLANGYQTQGDAESGPLAEGDYGQVIENLGGSKPCRVKVVEGKKAGQIWVYMKGALRKSGRHRK